MQFSTEPVALGGLQLHDWFTDSGDDGYSYDFLDIREYDVAALANNWSQAFPYGINSNYEIEETLSTRQNNHSQQIVGSLEIGDSYRIEPDNSNFDHRTRDMKRNGRRRQVSLEWIFAISNFILELPSVVLDQLSSAHKPQYALFAMLISFSALFICITELIYKGRKEKVICRWRGRLPWFYNASQNYKPFGTFKDTVGSICALCQCVFTTVNYAQADTIKISVWPVIFAFGLLCSKMLENPERRTAV